jgi:hypothetical protein
MMASTLARRETVLLRVPCHAIGEVVHHGRRHRPSRSQKKQQEEQRGKTITYTEEEDQNRESSPIACSRSVTGSLARLLDCCKPAARRSPILAVHIYKYGYGVLMRDRYILVV